MFVSPLLGLRKVRDWGTEQNGENVSDSSSPRGTGKLYLCKCYLTQDREAISLEVGPLCQSLRGIERNNMNHL